jgi:hypothetical protein
MKRRRQRKARAAETGSQPPVVKQAGPYFAYSLAILIMAALALRLYAAFDNFWLDEIFTYFLAKNKLHSLIDVFTGIKVEHQFMVTLSMYLMGDQMNWVWYRLPSVIMGTGTLALMALVGYRRMSTAAMTITVAVAAVSYPLIVYSSEARGYAPAAFFSLVMFACIEAYWRSRNRWYLTGFWSATMIAVLYHPAAVTISLALGLWSLAHEWRLGGGFPRIFRELALCHAVPLAFMAWLYFAIMQQWGSVGGDILPVARVLGDTMAVAIGLPMQAEFRWWALFLGSALIAAGLLILSKRVRSDIWIFYISALLVAPILMLVINGRSYVYVRYFVILFPFFYLMLGEAMDAIAGEFTWARKAVIGLCVLMLAGNSIATVNFLRVGRGGHLDAVNYMAANTPRPNITVGGDHSFRNGYPIEFYSRYLNKDRSMVYLRNNAWPTEGPDWFLVHNTCSEENVVPRDAIRVRNKIFRLRESYPVLGLSGLGWHLYRNDSLAL